jgi:hypothetical protein
MPGASKLDDIKKWKSNRTNPTHPQGCCRLHRKKIGVVLLVLIGTTLGTSLGVLLGGAAGGPLQRVNAVDLEDGPVNLQPGSTFLPVSDLPDNGAAAPTTPTVSPGSNGTAAAAVPNAAALLMLSQVELATGNLVRRGRTYGGYGWEAAPGTSLAFNCDKLKQESGCEVDLPALPAGYVKLIITLRL